MTYNEEAWRRPHLGRLGKSDDYVGENGYGHEDWNFAGDVWHDGLLHLYLRQGPARAYRNETFNIALGVRTVFGHALIGFAENVRYVVSDLPKEVWERRARELQLLDQYGSLGSEFSGLTLHELVEKMKGLERKNYSVALRPDDLIVLENEAFVPKSVLEIKSKRYQLLKLSERKYRDLKQFATGMTSQRGLPNSEFPEGAIVERLHRQRERDPKLVRAAKQEFTKLNGRLFCEVCGFEPASFFNCATFENSLIEAHHDVPLSAADHTGFTELNELKMVCPTCHRALHSVRPWLRVREFKENFGF